MHHSSRAIIPRALLLSRNTVTSSALKSPNKEIKFIGLKDLLAKNTTTTLLSVAVEWDQAKPAGPVGICAIGVQGSAHK